MDENFCRELQACPGCGGLFERKPPTSVSNDFARYGVNSSACGAAYQDLIAYEYEHGCFNRHSPQAYAVQHPPHALLQQQLGIDDRLQAASRQSVWIHLFALYLMLEKHMPLPEVFNAMKVLLDRGVVLKTFRLRFLKAWELLRLSML